MDIKSKIFVLEQVYRIYGEFAGSLDLACHKRCACCCTCHITATTLEAYHMMAGSEPADGNRLLDHLAQADPLRFRPQVTINRLADLCAKDQPLPDEDMDRSPDRCPVLEDDLCPLYEVRPFGCRAMVSASDCAATGSAEMDPFVLTVNNVFMQTIEHIDAQGYTGNLIDVARFLGQDQQRRDYEAARLADPPAGLLANQPMFALMIAPEHRERIAPLMTALRGIQVPA